MASLSNYLENQIIDWLLRGQAYTPPATVYIGLSTTATADDSFGTEPSGNNYGRVAVSASLANWAGTQAAGSTTASTGTGGQTSNNVAVNFPTPSGSWGTATHWFISDAASGGNLLFHSPLTASKTIGSGDTVSFANGALTVTIG